MVGNFRHRLVRSICYITPVITCWLPISPRKIQEQQAAAKESEPILAREMRVAKGDAAQRVWAEFGMSHPSGKKWGS